MKLFVVQFPTMKTDIHPKYYEDAKVICTCGNTFTVGSTKPEIKVEVCSNCHPFYTGQSRLVDTEGRVEKFQRRVQTAQATKAKAKKKIKKAEVAEERPSTLREMLTKVKEEEKKA